jgi:PAS domain S-box-containing protein
VVLFLVGGAIGFLRDLAVRVDAQARQIAAQGRRLADEIATGTDAEAALRTSEARHRELVERAADLIYAHELHGTLTAVNEAAESVLGYRPEELIGTNVQDIVAPSSRERSRQALVARLEGGQPQTYEVEIVAKSGALVPMEVSHRLVYADGQVVGVEGIARDVSSRRRVEAARQESEARFRAVFDGAGVGVAITSLTGQIQESNALLQQMLGLDAERLRGRQLVDLVDRPTRRRCGPPSTRWPGTAAADRAPSRASAVPTARRS